MYCDCMCVCVYVYVRTCVCIVFWLCVCMHYIVSACLVCIHFIYVLCVRMYCDCDWCMHALYVCMCMWVCMYVRMERTNTTWTEKRTVCKIVDATRQGNSDVVPPTAPQWCCRIQWWLVADDEDLQDNCQANNVYKTEKQNMLCRQEEGCTM